MTSISYFSFSLYIHSVCLLYSISIPYLVLVTLARRVPLFGRQSEKFHQRTVQPAFSRKIKIKNKRKFYIKFERKRNNVIQRGCRAVQKVASPARAVKYIYFFPLMNGHLATFKLVDSFKIHTRERERTRIHRWSFKRGKSNRISKKEIRTLSTRQHHKADEINTKEITK